MGMESYFFTIKFFSLLNEVEIKQCISKYCVITPYKMKSGSIFKPDIIDYTRFVIDKKAAVRILVSEGITTITFEICFANYLENLNYIYGVAHKISKCGSDTKLIVHRDIYEFDSVDEEQFKKIICNANKKKHELFVKENGELFNNYLPGHFYSKRIRK